MFNSHQSTSDFESDKKIEKEKVFIRTYFAIFSLPLSLSLSLIIMKKK